MLADRQLHVGRSLLDELLLNCGLQRGQDPRIDAFLSAIESSIAGPVSPGDLRALFELFPTPLAVVDSEMNLLSANPQFEAIFGKLENRSMREWSAETPLLQFLDAMRDPNFKRGELSFPQVSVSGITRWYQFHCLPYAGGSKALLAGSEISDLREAGRAMAERNRRLDTLAKLASLGEMSASIIHEINNPLGVILGSSQIMTRALSKPEPDREKLLSCGRRIEDMAVRMRKIIRGCLSLAREGENDPFVSASLKTIVEETVDVCSVRFKEKGIGLILQVPDLAVQCRSTQIAQVLSNLINNSFDAIEKMPRPWVRVTAKESGEFVEIRVIDSGEGISEEVEKRLFEPFFTTKSATKGTGIGLSLALKIAADHGGKLALDRSVPNTCFCLSLPRAR